MKIVRYQQNNNLPMYGWIHDTKIGAIQGSIFDDYYREPATIPIEEVRLLVPCEPSKIICIGRNYAAHAQEHDADIPTLPLLFLKPPSSLIGDNDVIKLPSQSKQVEHEAELVVVINKIAHLIDPEEAPEHILGYSIANDVTARDLQRSDSQWTRAKGFDTFCPIGPWIDTTFIPLDALVTCRINGEIRQMASTRDMVFGVNELIAYISSIMTLEPGDVILTGTPAGVSPLYSGDEIEITIDGLGQLRNTVS